MVEVEIVHEPFMNKIKFFNEQPKISYSVWQHCSGSVPLAYGLFKTK